MLAALKLSIDPVHAAVVILHDFIWNVYDCLVEIV
jgi:hypothetical protein